MSYRLVRNVPGAPDRLLGQTMILFAEFCLGGVEYFYIGNWKDATWKSRSSRMSGPPSFSRTARSSGPAIL